MMPSNSLGIKKLRSQGVVSVLANLLRKLDTRVPWIVSPGGSRLELEIPAYMVSLTVHALFLVILALAGHHVHKVVQRELQSQVLDSAITSSESTFQDLDQSSEPPSAIPCCWVVCTQPCVDDHLGTKFSGSYSGHGG